jgi:hypothetical protein
MAWQEGEIKLYGFCVKAAYRVFTHFFGLAELPAPELSSSSKARPAVALNAADDIDT